MRDGGQGRIGIGFYLAIALLSVAAIVVTQLSGGPTPLVAGAFAAAWGLFLSLQAPAFIFRSGFFLILVGGTEFRVRDPLAGVQGSVDTQIAFELAVYGFVAWLTLRALLRLPRAARRLNVIESALVAYVALAAASALWSPIAAYTLTRALQLAILLGYALVLIRSYGADDGWRLVGASIVAYTASFSVLGFFAYLAGLAPPYGPRFSWFDMHPIEVGSYAALAALGLAVGLLFGDRAGPRRRLRQVATGIFTVMLFATLSRGPLVAFVVTAAALVTIRVANRAVATLAVVVGTTGALLLLNLRGGVFTMFDVLARLPGAESMLRGQTAQELFALTGRLELWRSLWPAFELQPLLGHGYQVTRIVGMQIAPWAGEAHNGLLQSLVDLGVIGTVLLMGALLAALVVSYLHTVSLDAGPSERAVRASQFAAVLFLFVNSIGTAGFAGVPGFEPFVLYAAAAACRYRAPDGSPWPGGKTRRAHPSRVSG